MNAKKSRKSSKTAIFATVVAASLTMGACGGSEPNDSSAASAPVTQQATESSDSARPEIAPEASDPTDPPDDGSNSEGSGDDVSAGNEAGGSASSSVDEYCTMIDEFIVEMDKLTSDPANADTAVIQSMGDELADAALAIGVAADPADVERFEECSLRLTELE